MLSSLDYTSEENKQIIDLLLQCFHHPAHIRNDDVSLHSAAVCSFSTIPAFFLLSRLRSGAVSLMMCVLSQGKRFLVFLFSWNVNFIWVIHGTIKNQLEFYSKYEAHSVLADTLKISFHANKPPNSSIQGPDDSYYGDLLQSVEEGWWRVLGED